MELHIHSGRAVTGAVLSAISQVPNSSLRLAEPGEFTRRAFESGRIDLTEAEGIRDLIDAETESQRKLAIRAAEVCYTNRVFRIKLTRIHIGSGQRAI